MIAFFRVSRPAEAILLTENREILFSEHGPLAIVIEYEGEEYFFSGFPASSCKIAREIIKLNQMWRELPKLF